MLSLIACSACSAEHSRGSTQAVDDRDSSTDESDPMPAEHDANVDEEPPDGISDAGLQPDSSGPIDPDDTRDAAVTPDGAIVQEDARVDDDAAITETDLPDASTDPDSGTVDPDSGTVDPDSGTVDPDPVSGEGLALPFRVVDAEYSDALELIVLVSAEPNRLIALDPETGDFEDVALPLTPSSVSVHPDGLSAAVGHNGYISVIELAPLDLLDTLPVTADVSDVVLAGNGYAYAFPRIDQWVDLHSIELATGDETSAYGLRAGTVGRLHPAGDRMYGADRGLSPSDIERYDISGGTGVLSYDSPYHGDYGMCGNLWFSEDGARIFTACGNVFRASNVRMDDMTYNGALEGNPRVRHLASSDEASLVAIAHSPAGFVFPGDPLPPTVRQVGIYEGDFLNYRQTLQLPGFEVASNTYDAEGRFVFFNADGTRLYVLVEAEAAAPLIHNYGVVRYTVGESASSTPIVVDDEPPVVDPDPVATPSAGILLDYRVTDAEYSRALDRIVLVANDPARLIVLDPETGEHESESLPLTVAAVSVHPDGASAATAHNGYLGLATLDPVVLDEPYEVTADVSDVVLAGNGYAYAFPRIDQWVDLHSIELATGDETSAYGLRAGTVGRLHPAGDRMYGADRGLSPSDIERYDISGGTGVLSYDSPYHGDYGMCGNLWFSEDGARIFTACGNVFRASNVRMDDMTYNGALEGSPGIRHLHHSADAGLVVVVPHSGSTLLLFEDAFLESAGTLPLPSIQVGGTTYATSGRFAFFSADGAAIHVLAEAPTAPLVENYVLVTFAL